MTKKLMVFAIVVCMLFTLVISTQATDNKSQPQRMLSKPQMIPKNIPYYDKLTMEEPILFTDDFEGAKANWVSDASWNHVSTAAGGRAFQDSSAWELVSTNSHSPTHSWHAKLGLDEELDFIVSPVIKLPTEVTTGGVTSPLKGLKLGYWYDVDAPTGTHTWAHLVGSAECWWHFTTTDPGAGTSSWYLEPVDIQHWRQWLVTPDINLTGAANLTFKHKYDSEVEFDYYSVDISTDNFVSYTNLAFYDGSTKQTAWTDVTINLAAYAGKTVKIRFSSKGDYGTAVGFWGIDEIKVSDGTTTFFYDNGGEAGTTTMTKGGFAPGANFSTQTAGGVSHATPAWTEIEAFNVSGFNTAFFPGDSVRLAFQWLSDGTGKGRGLFVDDVTLYGVGLLPYDVAALGAVGFEKAAVGNKLNLGVVVANAGLNNITASLTWNGEIASITGEDTVVVQPGMFGMASVKDFASGSTVVIPTNAAREWLVTEPGEYLFRGKVIYGADGNPKDNTFSVDFTVYGAPFTNVVYRQDFEPRAGETSLEEFGFIVINDGGCKATGLNVNKWENIAFNFGDGSAIISAFWGATDPGPDVTTPLDSSEVLKEHLITPEIDISNLGHNSTLFMNYFVYFRSGYPGAGYVLYGAQKSDFSIDFTVDDGATWNQAFFWSDYDGLPGNGPRLPNNYYSMTNPIGTWSHLGVDLTKALLMGGQKLRLRFVLNSENSYFAGLDIDNIVIYSGIDYARITSVADIPDDQGKQVRVTWKASFNDLKIWSDGMYGQFEQHLVTYYNLWRLIPSGSSGVETADLKTMLANPGKPGASFILGNTQYDFIATIPAHFDAVYNYVSPTLWDKVETSFMVSAHTSDPMVFVNSLPVSGKSIDNLAPSAPMNVMAVGQNNTNIITWEASPDEDVKYYSVYRSETSGAYQAQPLAYLTDLTYTDQNVVIGKTYFYVVTATDFGLNESKRSNESSVLTGVEKNKSAAIPQEFALDQNYPNPFNPTTYITYQLPTSAHVTIVIFNTSGQEIKTLVNKDMNAGYHTVVWDGTNNAGEKVTSGLYLYQIKTGSFTNMKKMMLIR